MRPDPIDTNGADRPMHPALKNVLVFVVGALFGAVCSFIFVTLHAPLSPQTVFCPPVPAAAVAAPLQSATPARSVVPPANANRVSVVNAAQSVTTPASAPPAEQTPVPAPAPAPTERPTAALLIPVAGVQASQLTDTYSDARSGGRVHDAIDIMAPRGTQVIAADDGKVAKLFYSKQGGLTVYQFDSSEKFAYYYAHLDSYAPGLAEGKQLRRGDPIGLVGFSGDANAAAPHLHFAITVLGPEKHWWQGTAINPYPLLRGH